MQAYVGHAAKIYYSSEGVVIIGSRLLVKQSLDLLSKENTLQSDEAAAVENKRVNLNGGELWLLR
jgi:hypothetical protein